ncbi:type II toxin-antitoxin system RelE/ParE family toxin [Burkholderia alba]|uniref:type II toxin-antitoxin system RelE/ParE family toxin n=1 Tax=Burkholderia alba TaxID=2683677 RepID=UPI002B0533DC|nr:type II toxin-antitoxin system RelE/ParE family toxin [Burkholderia alba]
MLSTSPAAAARAGKVIQAAGYLIAENPGFGAPRAEFREWTAKFGRSSFVLRYAILDDTDVLVTRVWHSRELREPTGEV